MLFATPKFMIQGVVAAHKLGWRPQLYIASVSIEPTIMEIARTNAPELTKGALSIAFLKNPNDPVWAKDPATALYRRILKTYAPVREGDRRLQLVRDDRRLDDGRDAEAGREEPHPRRSAACGAEPRPEGEPVPAARHRGPHEHDELLSACERLPVPVRQRAMDQGEQPCSPHADRTDAQATRPRIPHPDEFPDHRRTEHEEEHPRFDARARRARPARTRGQRPGGVHHSRN